MNDLLIPYIGILDQVNKTTSQVYIRQITTPNLIEIIDLQALLQGWGLDRLIIIFILLCLNRCGLTGDLLRRYQK